MDIHKLDADLAVSGQISPKDIQSITEAGFKSIIVNRPDDEAPDQPNHHDIISAAEEAGLKIVYLPVIPGRILNTDINAFAAARAKLPRPALAYCASGTRAATLWVLSQADGTNHDALLEAAKAAGYDLSGISARLQSGQENIDRGQQAAVHHDVLIIGGGAAGIAVAASLRRRRNALDIAIIEPSEDHYYQPGFTLVGGDIFAPEQVKARTERLIPKGVTWLHASAASIQPDSKIVILEDGEKISYSFLIVACGLKIDLEAIPGLKETLGKNNVTTNYLFDHAPYTAKLADQIESGVALFTQPKGPFKCAGAPQKAMYLTCDKFRSRGVLSQIDVSFHMPGGALFGIDAYVPALKQTVQDYGINVHFSETLISVNGSKKLATFQIDMPDGQSQIVERPFDMLHVVPPQCAPDIISTSLLADAAGWADVDPESLQHKTYSTVFALGDVASSPNAKTAAAVRKQAPTVAENLLALIDRKPLTAAYSGYGSCPLIVSRGKALLAEFRYGGKVDPTFPAWLVDGEKPTGLAWWLKTRFMKHIYYRLMFKGREWMATPERLNIKQTPKDETTIPISDDVPPKKVA